MEDKIKKYEAVEHNLPDTILGWELYGAGLENFGKDSKPVELPMPQISDDELLVRVDTIGLCFSDVKLITQGSTHPRITGRDLINDPTIPGHEPSVTVVRVGDNRKGEFKVGERYAIQADVFYKGVSMAFGYVLRGAMSQYQVITKEVIDGDEGCYLIPIKQSTGYIEAALVEPWACCVAALRIKARRNIKAGGTLLVVGADKAPSNVDFSKLLDGKNVPAKIIAAGVPTDVESFLSGFAAKNAVEFIKIGTLSADAILPLCQERTGQEGFNDVVVLGTPSVDLAEAIGKNLAKAASMNIVATEPIGAKVPIDIGRVHYDNIAYIGTTKGDVADGYTSSRDSHLKPGGAAWFIGAAGPMGQMHVQLAVESAQGPKKILASDADSARIQMLRDKVDEIAAKKNVEIVYVNPVEQGQEALNKAIQDMTGGAGFDDIVMLAPVPVLIAGAIPHLGQNGVMNVFAGLPRGTVVNIDLEVIYTRQARFVGSSGSLLKDMKDTLGMAESGELTTNNSLGAIGGIEAVHDGIAGVKSQKFAGKTVIYPQIKGLPLMGVDELKDKLPNVAAKLKNGKFWTNEAEEELLNELLVMDWK